MCDPFVGGLAMQVIECQDVDLISPFPSHEIPRLRRWLYCYKSLILDDSIATEEDLETYLVRAMNVPNGTTWGLIDKFNKTNAKHEAPLVGFVGFELTTPYNGYIHLASSRSCWGNGFIDEAVKKVITLVFDTIPVLRVSCALIDRNKPAKALLYRLGFSKDGKFENFILQNGQPQTVVHFGLTRERWQELCQ
jgi:RimJ/RimL family protein N-acetyltransferase